jgi:hypothetical protein
MISAKEGKKHTCFLRWLGASEEEFTPGMSRRSIIPTQVITEEVNLKGSNTAPSLQGHNKAPLGHQSQDVEVVETSKEDIEISVGAKAKAKTPPFARCLRRPRWPNRDKATGRFTLRPTRRRTKTCDEVVSYCGLVQHGGPRVIRPTVTGPVWPLRVTGLICKGLPVITVCTPALWEYSGDNLGT